MLRILLVLLHVAVCAFCYWRLVPRLSTTAKRLTTFMLAAHLVVTVMAIEFRPITTWEGWLWDLDTEHNIASTLASTQLAMVGGAALLTSWLARARPRWQRLYLIGIANIFFLFATEEYYSFRGRLDTWLLPYLLLGACMSCSILVAAARAPRQERVWHICLLAGLAISALGSTVVEELRFWKTCQTLGLFFLGQCRIYAIEESLEFLGIWMALIAIFGLFDAVSPRPQPRARRLLYFMPVLWILICPQWIVFIKLEGLLTAQPASVLFESEAIQDPLHLYGYRLGFTEGSAAFTLYATASRRAYSRLGLSVHLVDQATGASIANINQPWGQSVGYFVGPGDRRIYRKSSAVEIPRTAPPNRALWLVLTIWHKIDERHVFDTVVASDHRLLGDSQVVLGEFVIPAASPARFSSAPAAVFDNGLRVAAIDALAPAQAGQILILTFTWQSDTNGHPDYAQFLHFVHAESGEQWGFDQQPLGPRLPTRLWYSGLADSETWEIPLPADLAPGRYQLYTGLYRRGNLERVGASDANGTPFDDMRVPLGVLVIEA